MLSPPLKVPYLVKHFYAGSDVVFVHVAPPPIFARLKRLHDRVVCGVEVFGGVLVLRTVATTHVATNQADAKVYPTVAHLQALFTPVGARRNFTDFFDVYATHGLYLVT